jgi:L-lactate dehydrogenase complex protein LldG
MSLMSRENILNKIRQNRPKELVEMPQNITFEANFSDKIEKFTEVLRGIGGTVLAFENIDAISEDLRMRGFEDTTSPTQILKSSNSRILNNQVYVNNEFSDAKTIINLVPEITFGNADISIISDPHDLAPVDVAILRGQLGVAENGSIWLDESDFGGHRVLPFITQHLIVVLSKTKLVSNMHEAYAQLDITKTGFGLFLAGPSKTADIEQSLVIGAHGARSLVVLLVD